MCGEYPTRDLWDVLDTESDKSMTVGCHTHNSLTRDGLTKAPDGHNTDSTNHAVKEAKTTPFHYGQAESDTLHSGEQHHILNLMTKNGQFNAQYRYVNQGKDDSNPL